MGQERGRAGVVLRVAVGAVIAAVAVLALLYLTAPREGEVDPRVARSRPTRPDPESYVRVAGIEAVGLAAVVGLSLGLGVAAGAAALRPRGGRPAFAPAWPWIGLGLALGLVGPALLWPAQDSPRGPYTSFDNAMTGWLCVAVGCTLVGAGFRPRGSLRRGALLALALYVLVGFVLSYWGRVERDPVEQEELAHPAALASAAGAGLFWPFGVAEEYGLFGYVTFAN